MRGWRVLVVAPSNVAVDNLLQSLLLAAGPAAATAHVHESKNSTGPSSSNPSASKRRVEAVRLGHPARASPQVLAHCLDARLTTADGFEVVQGVRQELTSVNRDLSKLNDRAAATSSGKGDSRAKLQRSRTELRQELGKRESKLSQSLLKR